MDSWETELFDSGPYNDDSLFVNFFDAGEEARPMRGGHQRNQSAALTMQYPLYPQSHFDIKAEEDSYEGVGLGLHENSGAQRPGDRDRRHHGRDLHSEPLAEAPEAPKAPKAPKAREAREASETPGEGAPAAQTPAQEPAASAKSVTLPSGRRRISKEQTKILEDSFQKNTHLDKAERERVCRATGLMVKNVNIWFQNRRQKAKSQAQQQDKSDIVGFFANRDKRGSRRKPEPVQVPSQPTSSVQHTPQRTPIATPKTPFRGTPTLQKRNSAAFQGSPSRDLGMQKPLFQEAYGLGVSNFDLPNSPQQYSPTPSTLGEVSPAQQFPQYITTPKQLWDLPPESSYPYPVAQGRQSPPRMGHRSLMQSPQLVSRASVSSPQVYPGPSRPSLAGALARSKSAAEITPVYYDDEYPGLKRRCSNFGRSNTLNGLGQTPIFPTSSCSTAGNSTQVSPRSSPPSLHTVGSSTSISKTASNNAPFDAIGAAQAQRMMASRTRSHTQPSIRYDSGVRLHLDDSNHQAVLVMVDRAGDRTGEQPIPGSALPRTSLGSRSTAKVPSALNAGIHIPPPTTAEAATVSPQQYMLDKNLVFYDDSIWQDGSFAGEEPSNDGFFDYPTFDT